MKTPLLILMASLFAAAGCLSAASACPTTSADPMGCDFLITINSTGTASLSTVAGATAFNSALTFNDGTMDPGNDGSLVGVINNDANALISLSIAGTGANAGIFDLSYNGICVYTNASYCATAQSGYEGPTTTFSNLQSMIPFETTSGMVTFGPTLAGGSSTFFSIQDAPSDISSHGGLTVSNVMLATPTATATPEPADFSLIALGGSLVLFARRKFTSKF